MSGRRPSRSGRRSGRRAPPRSTPRRIRGRPRCRWSAPDGNRLKDAARVRVDARDAAATEVGHPDTARSGRNGPRVLAHRDGIPARAVRLQVDPRKRPVALVRDPREVPSRPTPAGESPTGIRASIVPTGGPVARGTDGIRRSNRRSRSSTTAAAQASNRRRRSAATRRRVKRRDPGCRRSTAVAPARVPSPRLQHPPRRPAAIRARVPVSPRPGTAARAARPMSPAVSKRSSGSFSMQRRPRPPAPAACPGRCRRRAEVGPRCAPRASRCRRRAGTAPGPSAARRARSRARRRRRGRRRCSPRSARAPRSRAFRPTRRPR